ncbi:MAG: hypothetical protein J7578_23660 [Chitinophagaceae bacterium]|nr:hypothetical protein [Chitinophagaceae bacterium]
MKCWSILFLLPLSFLHSGCLILSKNQTDKSKIKFITKNPDLVRDAALFFIDVDNNKVKSSPESKKEFDKWMKKIKGLGSTVVVAYGADGDREVNPFTVIFKETTLFGVTEVIYDFASDTRRFPDVTGNPQAYYFIKVTDRIYYKRRQIPMM